MALALTVVLTTENDQLTVVCCLRADVPLATQPGHPDNHWRFSKAAVRQISGNFGSGGNRTLAFRLEANAEFPACGCRCPWSKLVPKQPSSALARSDSAYSFPELD
jgi:hypothetical protein